jgi:hypothetical protein
METAVYNWIISQMDTKPHEDGLTDVVVTVQWRRSATLVDGDKIYYADVYGSMGCATPSATDFTAYPDLTFEQVCGWLEAGLDVSSLDINLDKQIEDQINPPIIVLPNPWITTTTTTTEAPTTTTEAPTTTTTEAPL